MAKTLFISFEGIEGAGKTTQIQLLSSYFTNNNIAHIVTREPGGLKISEEIRKIILNNKINSITELLLFEAARYEHTKEIIEPNLNNNISVICDRFYDSSYAYQGFGRGLDLDIINFLNTIASNKIEPDFTFFLDLDPNQIEARLKKRAKTKDRIENEKIEFFKKVRAGFLDLASKHNRFKIIDASLNIETIHNKIIEIIKGR